jgi:hypothetical protein
MKRQRGRNRSSGGGGGKPQQQNANRAFDSNGPEGVKVRGNAQHVFEKYQQLSRDASAAGDRVLGENYLQHAEHYFRLLRAMQPTRPASEILGRDHFSSGFDIDFEDEGAQAQAQAADEAAEAGGEPPEPDRNGGWQGERPRDDRQRDDRPRDDRPRDERPRDDRPRDDRPRGDRFENREPRVEGQGRRDRWQRDDRPRDERPRDDRPREDRAERAPREDRREPVESAPVEERPTRMLRDADGGESHAPAFLQASAAPRPEAADEEPARKPRRRRAPRSEGDGPPPSETEDA